MIDELIWMYKALEEHLFLLKHQRSLILGKVERLMGDQQAYTGKHGSCGYEKSLKLDNSAWHDALVDNSDLFAIQHHYDKAKKLLEDAQKPYMKEPEESFCIW